MKNAPCGAIFCVRVSGFTTTAVSCTSAALGPRPWRVPRVAASNWDRVAKEPAASGTNDRLGGSNTRSLFPSVQGSCSPKSGCQQSWTLLETWRENAFCASLLTAGVAPCSWHSLAGGGVAPVHLCLHTALLPNRPPLQRTPAHRPHCNPVTSTQAPWPIRSRWQLLEIRS